MAVAKAYVKGLGITLKHFIESTRKTSVAGKQRYVPEKEIRPGVHRIPKEFLRFNIRKKNHLAGSIPVHSLFSL